MSRMQEVARILDLELGERFQIYNPKDKSKMGNGSDYYLDNRGLINSNDQDNNINNNVVYYKMLTNLLTGELEIIYKAWKPRTGQRYYMIDCQGDIREQIWEGREGDKIAFKIGNCFKSLGEITRDHILKYKDFINSKEAVSFMDLK